MSTPNQSLYCHVKWGGVNRSSTGFTYRSIQGSRVKRIWISGKVLGRMVFSGLDVKINSHEAGQDYVEDILIDNAPIERKKVYRIATGDLFTFGSMLPEVSRSPVKQLFLPEFIRDLLQETLMQKRNP